MTAFIQQACRDIGGFEPRLEYPTDDVAMAPILTRQPQRQL